MIYERYERGALIIASNRAFTEWSDLLHSPLLASAAPDRHPRWAHQIIISEASAPSDADATAQRGLRKHVQGQSRRTLSPASRRDRARGRKIAEQVNTRWSRPPFFSSEASARVLLTDRR